MFLVNHRGPRPDAAMDERSVFQAGLRGEVGTGFVARPNLRGQPELTHPAASGGAGVFGDEELVRV